MKFTFYCRRLDTGVLLRLGTIRYRTFKDVMRITEELDDVGYEVEYKCTDSVIYKVNGEAQYKELFQVFSDALD